jgi:Holliday junction resolvase
VASVGFMVSPKLRGVNYEYRIAYLFERFGYSWDRSGSSLGIDLKISKGGKLRYLVSCKKTSTLGPIYLPRLEVDRLAASASSAGVRGLVCFGFKRTPILALPLEQVRRLKGARLSYKLYPTDGRPLIKFLSEANACESSTGT